MSAQTKADELMKIFEAKVKAKPYGSKNWGKSIVLNFTDADAYLITFAMDGTIAKIEKGKVNDLKPKGVATISTTTDILDGVWKGKINGTNAFMEGKIRNEGSMQALMKLQGALS